MNRHQDSPSLCILQRKVSEFGRCLWWFVKPKSGQNASFMDLILTTLQMLLVPSTKQLKMELLKNHLIHSHLGMICLIERSTIFPLSIKSIFKTNILSNVPYIQNHPFSYLFRVYFILYDQIKFKIFFYLLNFMV